MATPTTPVVVVTGGTGAVGSAVCRLLGERGQPVAFTYRANDKARDHVLEAFRTADVPARAEALDLTDGDAVARFVERTTDELGSVVALVHASGPFVPQRYIGQVEDAQLSNHLDDEVLGLFNVVKACLPQLRENSGSITAVTTVATRSFIVRDALSSIPKAAVEAMVRALAAEEGRYGVRANCVGPGILNEGMAQDLIDAGDFDEQAQGVALRGIALRRFGSALDVAELVCFLASDKAGYISGQKIDVDGGYGL
jgi:3-oxoacyl-[acyl-carrier protein] reductase